jgi:putative heme-binding domain-containing protein
MHAKLVTSILLAALLAVGCATTHDQTTPSSEAQSYSRDDVALGAKAYRTHCITCHGRNGEGNRGPDLTRGEFRHGKSDEALVNIVLDGISGTGMPGAWMSRSQAKQVVRYLRSLAGNQTIVETPGDPARGRVVFAETADCATCHVVDGTGGKRGPNLSTIGWQRSPDHIRQSILRPSVSVEQAYRRVQVFLDSGEEIDGLLLNEDGYSIQVMDGEERLRAFDKKKLARIVKPPLSLMPVYAQSLSRKEIDDLVAYLYSLKGTDNDE